MRSGTSKGSTISQYGCSTFGALATEAQYEEEEEEEEEDEAELKLRWCPICAAACQYTVYQQRYH